MDYNTILKAKKVFRNCDFFQEVIFGMISGFSLTRCECCQKELIECKTLPIKFENGENMIELAEKIGLIQKSKVGYTEMKNVEDFSDEFQIVCEDCGEEILTKYLDEI